MVLLLPYRESVGYSPGRMSRLDSEVARRNVAGSNVVVEVPMGNGNDLEGGDGYQPKKVYNSRVSSSHGLTVRSLI